jgi:hypothetical protein
MIAKRNALAVLLFAALGAYLVFGTAPRPMRGQPVPDDVAAEVRGGVCQYLSISVCPGNGTANCPSGTYVTAGTTYGLAAGSSYCSSSCGEYFAYINPCAG